MKKILIALLPLAVLASSCGSARKGSQVKEVTPVVVMNKDSLTIISSANPSCCKSGACYGADAAKSGLGFDVLSRLAESSKENIVFSPVSLSFALGMTADGAAGQTLSEMASVLGFKTDGLTDAQIRDLIRAEYAKTASVLESADSSVVMESANSVWTDKDFPIEESFVASVQKNFGAEARSVDFGSARAAREINSWCSDKTHGKIDNVVRETRGWNTALVNAVYFDAEWSMPFEKTSKGEFASIGGEKSEHTFLKRKDYMAYAECADYQMVELPYGMEGNFVMDVILPREGRAVAIDGEAYAALCSKLDETKVNFLMPEFRIESQSELAPVLASLGMSKAFSPEAEFPLISDASMMIDRILQKTYIDVTKDGTQAAAVTVVGIRLTSMRPDNDPVIDFIADRPFLFVVREKSSSEILFVGQKLR